MPSPLDEIFAETEDGKLCDRLFVQLLKDDRMLDASELTDGERVVWLVWHSHGIIGNGGFRYLFEGDFPGDLDFEKTAEAYAAIGATTAAKAFRDTFALFPNGRVPRTIAERLRIYLRKIKGWPTEQDDLFFSATTEIESGLANYIRANARAIRAALESRPNLEEHDRPIEEDESRQDSPLAELTHWKRVAFAARCARRVTHLIDEYWPGIPEKYRHPIMNAIELADGNRRAKWAHIGAQNGPTLGPKVHW